MLKIIIPENISKKRLNLSLKNDSLFNVKDIDMLIKKNMMLIGNADARKKVPI